MVKNKYIYRIESNQSWNDIVQSNGTKQIMGEIPTEGFIHCSDRDTLLLPANKYYQGRKDLVVLEIDTEKVIAEIKYEDLKGSGTAYPHVFAPININAVIRVIDFPCDYDGIFSLPALLAD
jgi:uncharacterized protein (DUF952 family)